MLAIIYPEKDYTSADIAIRTQALAKGQGRNVYVVPKHYGRVEESVYKQLAKSKFALLIAFDVKNIDTNTKNELDFLARRGVKIHAIIPDNMEIDLFDGLKFYRYSKTNESYFASVVQAFIEGLQTQLPKNKNKADEILTIVGTLLLTILYLGLVSDGKK